MKLNKTWLIPIILSLLAILFFQKISALENLPTTLIAIIALYFSYLAYRYTKEKFRLDLLERRILYYDNLINFLKIEDYKSKEAYAAAEKCIIGNGYAQSVFLFGPEIEAFVKEIQDNFFLFQQQATISDMSFKAMSPQEEGTWRIKVMESNGYLRSKAPLKSLELFRKYIYFGNYQNS